MLLAALLLAAVTGAASPLPSPSPTPTPSPMPSSSAAPSPSAAASASAAPLREVGRATATGRSANLIGKASAASQGTISQEQIATRPVLRPGEVLEAIPGLVISQHSGEGKANQYYLRGFQLDHGTDLESTVAGVPVNLPSHAHGQGYSDINWLIPELVSYVEFKKGPYYADQGDFSTAGAYNLYYRTQIDPVTEVGAGSYGYARYFTAGSSRAGAGTLLYAVELLHDNGSFARPDDYTKYNGVLRYSRSGAHSDFAVTAMAYDGPFNSTDQIPERLVADGSLSRFGYIDPTDGGNTYRYALSSQFTHVNPNGATKVNAYVAHTYLDLFSNFTYDYDDATAYFNETANPVTCNPAYVSCDPYPAAHHSSTYASYCPAYDTAPPGAAAHSVARPAYSFACGDQREQLDNRATSGGDVSRSFQGRRAETTVGTGVRNDNVAENGLFLTNDRVRYPLGTLSDDHIVERNYYAYAMTEFHAGERLRIEPGVRLDAFTFDVGAYQPQNSGTTSAAMVNPKLAAAWTLSRTSELYADFGGSYHSNDARSILGVVDPQTGRTFDASGAPVYQNTPLVRAYGDELGYRYSSPHITSTVSLYELLLSNELVFDGDDGTTSIGGPTVRRGIELANYWTPVRWLTYDADLATATARFLTDPLHVGTGVPESLNAVISAGVTVDKPHYAASLRLRYFGPRVLDTQGDAVSPPSTLLNGEYTAKLAHGVKVSLGCFNLLNTYADDVEYYYASWLPQDAANPANLANPAINPLDGGRGPNFTSVHGAGINDYHFHPSEKRTLRLTLSTRL
jgi:TonB-dependent receptor-like protein